MRVAWVSHQWPQPDDSPARPGLNPGRWAGGAEMLQELMRSRAPAGVELQLVDAHDPMELVEGADRLVVAGLEALSTAKQGFLARLEPLVWIMSPVRSEWRPLLEHGRPVWASEVLARSAGFQPSLVCPGWWDTSQVPAPRTPDSDALWAHRDVWHKGEQQARDWADRNGRQLTVLKNRPRPEVLEAMAGADTFVLFSPIVDPCPTAVIEAEIAGCDIVVSENVGRTPVRGRQANIEYVEGLADLFWGWVCD